MKPSIDSSLPSGVLRAPAKPGLAILALAMICAAAVHASADSKRKVVVLEYRSGSASLVGIGTQLATAIAKETSLDVVAPSQAKAMFGEQLEQAVVKCAGAAECVAKLGEKLGAVEVLLVGVSELGDVLLTMQRIDVASRAVAVRFSDSLTSAGPPSAAQVSDYAHRLLPPSDFLRFGVIEIIANQTGARVTVGGKDRGVTPIAPLRLEAPATYAIKIDKSGFVPFSTKVKLPPDGTLRVEAELSVRASKAWYQRWWVVVGLGLVVTGAAGTTIYYATRDEETLHFMGSVE